MRKNLLYVMSVAGIVLLVAACTKKGNTGPAGATGAAGPAYTGAINGHVSIYDQYGSKITNGLSTVALSLKGGTPIYPNNDGYYIFNNVGTGVYNISASGTGLGSTTLQNIQFINDSLYQDVKISQLPNFNLSSFKAYHNTGSGYDSLVIGFPTTTDSRPRNCIVFVGNTPAVGNNPANYLLTYIKPTVNVWAATLNIRIPAADLNNVGIFYGDKVYYAVYSYVTTDYSVYEDEATGKNVYNALGTGLVDSALAP